MDDQTANRSQSFSLEILAQLRNRIDILQWTPIIYSLFIFVTKYTYTRGHLTYTVYFTIRDIVWCRSGSEYLQRKRVDCFSPCQSQLLYQDTSILPHAGFTAPCLPCSQGEHSPTSPHLLKLCTTAHVGAPFPLLYPQGLFKSNMWSLDYNIGNKSFKQKSFYPYIGEQTKSSLFLS